MAVAPAIQSAHTAPQDGSAIQTLNAPDRLMLVAHDGLRAIGHPGFQCQTHVWLGGRLGETALRDGLRRLGRQYPVVTSRLDDAGGGNGPCWRYRADVECQRHDTDLNEADETAVWRHAEALFSTPIDLPHDDPISFHLLHLPDGRDVFIVRWCHPLMDGKAPELALREINRLSGVGTEAGRAPIAAADEVSAYLRRFAGGHRLRCALRVVRSQARLPMKSVTLMLPDAPPWALAPIRIAVRSLDEDQTAALTDRVKRLCGFANLSPAVLASVFRATQRLTPRPAARRERCQTDVPLNLRPPGAAGPIFRNFMSFVSLAADAQQMADRDDLTRMLNSQMRDQLRRGIELGNLQMMSLLSRFAGLLQGHIKSRLQHQPVTLGYGFLGPVVDGLNRFCGAAIERLYTLNAALGPPGITLQVNQSGGRLNLALSYISEVVPEPLARQYLDAIAEDLLAS